MWDSYWISGISAGGNYSRPKTHSSRLVSSGGLLKGIQTPLRKVSCFMQFTWSVRLNSLPRTAGRPSPSSNNPSATGHTRRKNSQQHPGAVFVQQSLNKTSMNQSTGEERSLRSNTTGDEGDYFFSALSQGERQTFHRLRKGIIASETLTPIFI